MSQWRIDQKDTIGPISIINDDEDVFKATDEHMFAHLIETDNGICQTDYTPAELAELRSLLGELLNAHHARQQGKMMRAKL